MLGRFVDKVVWVRVRAHLAAALVVGIATTLGVTAAPALAISKAKLIEEFKPFGDCPVTTAAVCTISLTTGGEIKMGSKTVPIDKTITLQGGLGTESFAAQPLIGAADGNTLSKTPLDVPGGLTGVELIGPITEPITGPVTATSELAGPPSSVTINREGIAPGRTHQETAVILPLKVHLENPVLGSECYVGSDAEPITLHLTAGKTKPPSGEPITGGVGSPSGAAKGKITILPATIVDNTFAVPGATGCVSPLSVIMDSVVDLESGIPSAAGSNVAIMKSTLEETRAEFAAKYRPKVKHHK